MWDYFISMNLDITGAESCDAKPPNFIHMFIFLAILIMGIIGASEVFVGLPPTALTIAFFSIKGGLHFIQLCTTNCGVYYSKYGEITRIFDDKRE